MTNLYENYILFIDYTMCWHINVISASFLSTVGQRRENIIMYLYIALTHRVFFTACWNYSTDIINRAIVGQISPLHYDASNSICLYDNCCVKR